MCHAVIARICPSANVIDIAHGIPRHDPRAGALILRDALPFAPAGVHLAIVDPDVGARRRAVALELPDDQTLVGPDNGLLSLAAERLGGALSAVEISRSPWRLEPVSATFHGRDIFAPVAARLAAGEPLADAGEPVRSRQPRDDRAAGARARRRRARRHGARRRPLRQRPPQRRPRPARRHRVATGPRRRDRGRGPHAPSALRARRSRTSTTATCCSTRTRRARSRWRSIAGMRRAGSGWSSTTSCGCVPHDRRNRPPRPPAAAPAGGRLDERPRP